MPYTILIIVGALYLLPGLVLLICRGDGINGGGEALIVAALWPLYVRSTREKRKGIR
jgi:hypothetical protein